MADQFDVAKASDDELLSRARINLPGNQYREAAVTEMEFRYAKRLIESINLLNRAAENTERSGTRMEFATWVILIATLIQLGLVVTPMVYAHCHQAAPQTTETWAHRPF